MIWLYAISNWMLQMKETAEVIEGELTKDILLQWDTSAVYEQKLKEQLEKYEDWNRRLQEFMDMDPDSREEVITQYRTSKELNDRFSSILNMYEKMFGMF